MGNDCAVAVFQALLSTEEASKEVPVEVQSRRDRMNVLDHSL